MRIIGGTLIILSGIPIFFIGIFVGWLGGFASYVVGWGAATVTGIGIAWFVMGIFAIIGGAVAVAGRAWILAMVGAVCTVIAPIWFYQIIVILFPVLIMGVLSVVFVARSRKSFSSIAIRANNNGAGQ